MGPGGVARFGCPTRCSQYTSHMSGALKLARLVFAVLAALVAASGPVLDLYGLLPEGTDLRWVVAGSLALFFVLVVWDRLDTESRINSLEAGRPDPVLALRRERDDLVMDVTNRGEAGTFRCEVRFLSTAMSAYSGEVPSPGRWYVAKWRSAYGNDEARIHRGGMHSVLLGEAQGSDPGVSGVTFPFTIGGAGATPQYSFQWIAGREPPVPVPEVRLRVTVTSEPSAVRGVVEKQICLDALGNLAEIAGRAWWRRLLRR